ncbi:MAG: TPM domain-containing protein [Chloroflexota bacterium]
MPRLRHALGRWLLLIVAAGAIAWPASVLALDLPPTQSGVYVYDLAHIWAPATIQSAQATIERIRERTEAQIAVVSWPTGQSEVDTGTARIDARTIMDAWGVGRAGVNDGLVVLFDMDTSLQHGQIYLYTGSGFRDIYLSDEEAAGIVDGAMLPKAKDGDLDGALLAGLAEVDHVAQPAGNPDRAGRRALLLAGSAVVAGGAAAFLGLFLLAWWRRGRDAAVPLIDDSVLLPAPPPALTPAMATLLRKDGVDEDAFGAALVDLGHRGLITFRAPDPDEEKQVDLVALGAQLDDEPSRDARRRPLGDAEATLLLKIAGKGETTPSLVGGSNDQVVTSSRLKKGEGNSIYAAFRKELGRVAAASGWFRDDPTAITGRWMSTGIGVVVAAVVVFFVFVLDRSEESRLVMPGREPLLVAVGVAAICGLAIAIFSRFMAARTRAGAEALAMALAYRNTLRYELAETKDIHTAVEKTTQRLPWITTPDELTVWAVALGLNSEIDRLIKSTMAEEARAGVSGWSPLWYSGAGGVTSVGSMVGSITATASSSSGSGYGGGGGGGGGGAGGGF